MRGRFRRESEGSCRSLQRSFSWHMHPTVTAVESNSFFKDGRKINVGDCGLFKPPQDSPPFIGLIRRLTLSKDNNLRVGVNWLYRPAELKLGKGSLLDSAPNEIFYSFHKDEILAASLLHPCKVAFLPRGAELPTGTSSFVCRRVYDIENKCLWWLTDQDYINERQEEVDQLLDKTRTEMHGTLQPGGRSPKQANGLTSASQLKPSSENAQNSGTSFPSQTKGKKRERGDHSTDPVKRERFSKTDDSGSGQYKIENNVKSDIAKITEKGGVVDFEGVEKLLQLMQHRVEKKMDLISRAMLAGVVAATEKIECLNRFVQLKGLSVFDEWLQEIHKGKVGGGNNSKDGDKSVEEFLLVLLRALDNLPVNLPALQTCNIGRSVNHLRSHKNVEIQKKARSLVDTWKKRVQAEMTSIDAETGSAQGGPVWSSKSRLPEASHAGSRTLSGSDVAMKSSITQHSASKTTSVKSSHGENNTKSASSSPGPVKPSSPPASVKESQPGTSVGGSGTPDAPLIREDRSSSSNQSHSYSPSISTKEEAKSSTAVSASTKISSSSSRNRKGGGFPGVSGVQKDSSSSRSLSSIRNSTSDKVSQSGMATERVSDGPVLEAGNPKLIVKISNRSRSPSQGVRGVSPEHPSALSSQTSQPVLSDKLDQFEHYSRVKSDALQCNASSDTNVESCRVNDREDVVTGSGDGAGSAALHLKEEKSISTEDSRQPMEGPKKNLLKCGKLHETSFSPMNALIESCVKYSEAHSSLSPEDDVGMNLLASVATGEMSRSEIVSPSDSTERSTPATEGVCFSDDAKSKPSTEDQIRGTESQQLCNDRVGVYKKQVLLNGSCLEDGLHLSKQASFSTDMDCHPSHTSADTPAGEGNKPYDAASTDYRSTADPNWEFSKNLTEKTDANHKTGDGEVDKEFKEENTTSGNGMDNIVDCKKDGTSVTGTEYKSGDDSKDTAKGTAMAEDAFLNQMCNMDCKSDVKDALMVGTNSMKKVTAIVVKSELKDRVSDEKTHQTSSQPIFSEAGDAVKVSEMDEKDIKTCVSDVERGIIDRRVDRNTGLDGCSTASSCSTGDGLRSHNMETATEKKEISELVSLPETGFPASVSLEGHTNDNIRGSKPLVIKADEVESSKVAEVPSAAARADPDARVRFDLNEGFTVDDGKYGEPGTFAASFPTTVQMSNSLQASVNHFPTLHPASITVAAAAKGAFVPPEDLLRSKGELGWKGSAATSAFRPAEPRKVIEVPLATANFSCDASTSKSGRAMLDIDLNIDLNEPDENDFETASRDCYLVNDSSIFLNKSSGFIPVLGSGGLDFDLNRVDESNETGQCSTSRSYNEENSAVLVKPSGGLPSADVRRGFDLNDQPGFDDGSAEHLRTTQQVKAALTSQLAFIGPRANNPGLGSLSSWFPPASTYSAAVIPSIMPDRTDQSFQAIPPGASQRMFGHAGISPFTPDVYRGSVLSSSPAVSFPSGPFQFPVFPYGHSFPLPSANFPIGGTSFADASSGTRLFAPPVNSQLLGSVGVIPSQFQRPFMVGLPDNSSNSGLENSRKWVRQGLDLNAGPGAVEGDVREDNLPHSSSQHSVINSHAQAEEQARLCPVSGLKRAEPDGGWDKETIRYKQSSWQ
ncbi:non-specific serine/threonine protein kinase [Salvia divinorum]|uniref:Non-specific serine/threonine protein kinase n=1 Tax=Salvia divinorum TaxID=28513 RepID=A0ABD1GES4_SALDI